MRKPGEAFEDYRNRLKNAAKKLKEYMAGRVLKGTETTHIKPRGRKNQTFSKLSMEHRLGPAYRARRKIKNKIAARSRRLNRMST